MGFSTGPRVKGTGTLKIGRCREKRVIIPYAKPISSPSVDFGRQHHAELTMKTNSLVVMILHDKKENQFCWTEVEELHWILHSKGRTFLVLQKDGTLLRFDGFTEEDYEKISSYVEHHLQGLKVKKNEAETDRNWAEIVFAANTLEIYIHGQKHLDIPFNNIVEVQMDTSKISIKYHLADKTAVKLKEFNFDVYGDERMRLKLFEKFSDRVMPLADICQAATDPTVAVFRSVSGFVPRGLFDLEICRDLLRIRCETTDLEIPYAAIERVFVLRVFGQQQYYFVVQLDPPVDQREELILFFWRDENVSVNLALSDEQLAKYKGNLSKKMIDQKMNIVIQLLKALANKEIISSTSFVGDTGNQSIMCLFCDVWSSLYPLESSFIFVSSFVIRIPFKEISRVVFVQKPRRGGLFDFEVNSTDGITYQFCRIDSAEWEPLHGFALKKNLKVITAFRKPSDEEDNGCDVSLLQTKSKDEGSQSLSITSKADEEVFAKQKLRQSETKVESADDDGSGDESDDDGVLVHFESLEPVKIVSEQPKKKKDARESERPMRPWFDQQIEALKKMFPHLSELALSRHANKKWKELLAELKTEEENALHRARLAEDETERGAASFRIPK